MTIVFVGKEAESMPGLAATFAKVHRENGFRESLSAIQIRTFLLEVTAWSSKSATAKAVLNAVHNSTRDVLLVGMKGGYQCFSSDEPSRGKGVVYVDCSAKLGVKIRGSRFWA